MLNNNGLGLVTAARQEATAFFASLGTGLKLVDRAAANVAGAFAAINVKGFSADMAQLNAAGAALQSNLGTGLTQLTGADFAGAAGSVRNVQQALRELGQAGAGLSGDLAPIGQLATTYLAPLQGALERLPLPQFTINTDAVGQVMTRLSQVDLAGLLDGMGGLTQAGQSLRADMFQGLEQLKSGDFSGAAASLQSLTGSLAGLKQAGAGILSSLGLDKLPGAFAGALPSFSGVQQSLSGLGQAAGRVVTDMSNLWNQGQTLQSSMSGLWGSLQAGDLTGTLSGLQQMGSSFLSMQQTGSSLVGNLTSFYNSAMGAKDAVFQFGKGIAEWVATAGVATVQQWAMTGATYAQAAAQWVAQAATQAWSFAQGIFNAIMAISPIGWIAIAVGAIIAVVILAVKYWDDLTGALTRFGEWVMTGLQSAFTSVLGWFTAIPQWISGVIQSFFGFLNIPKLIMDHFGGIITFFQGLWTSIQELWGNLTNWWSTMLGGWDLLGGLGTKLLDAGKNLVRMFVDGITAGWDWIKQSVSGAAGKIMDFLGFHSPAKMGPGADADRWAPNLMNMYSQGIEGGIPQVSDSALNVATALTGSLTPTEPISESALSAMVPAGLLTPSVTPAALTAGAVAAQSTEAARNGAAGAAGGKAGEQKTPIVVKLILEGREIAEAIVPVFREDALLAYGR